MLDTAELRKARGAFFTPPAMADFLAEWVVRRPSDRVLEPSCGEAAFLLSAAQRLEALGADPIPSASLRGVDVHAESVERAGRLLRDVGAAADLSVGDFFDFAAEPEFDGVIGNPPYVRYQSFTGENRAKAQKAALAQGVRMTGLASSWAAFVVHAGAFLKPEGRLALVLPAELLSVNYAAPVRRYLMERFARVRLILFEGLVFPGVFEEVVLLLAEGQGPTDHFDVEQAKGLEDLGSLDSTRWYPEGDGKWLPALLDAEAAETYADLTRGEAFETLEAWGETDLGMVTGNNRYFTLTADEACAAGLRDSELMRISPPSSRHLRGLNFTEKAWREMARDGARVFLFDPKPTRLSAAAERYIAQGERKKVHKAYKCRVRKPWYCVPKVRTPDLFLTYMNHDLPRLATNRAGVRHLNSIHGVTLGEDVRALGMDLLPIASLNSVTALGSELVGRSYGGGMLKIEPKEADILPLPSAETVRAAASELRALRPQLTRFLRGRDVEGAIRLVDRTLLIESLGVKSKQLEHLREARRRLFARRRARASKVKQ